MAAPVINNIALPVSRVLVTPDGPDPEEATTGIVFRNSAQGSSSFGAVGSHVLYVREMTTEVVVDSVEYLAMHESAIVGIIPE